MTTNKARAGRAARNAKLASLPVGMAGRAALGFGVSVGRYSHIHSECRLCVSSRRDDECCARFIRIAKRLERDAVWQFTPRRQSHHEGINSRTRRTQLDCNHVASLAAVVWGS